MGQSEIRYALSTRQTYVDTEGVMRYVGEPWYKCPRCKQMGYAGTLGHGCTACDNHFSHGLPDPLVGWENEGGQVG